jgi:hypothetical protein
MDRLVLNEFKDAYRGLQPYLVKHLDFLVYGLLVQLSGVMDARAEIQAVGRHHENAIGDKPLKPH